MKFLFSLQCPFRCKTPYKIKASDLSKASFFFFHHITAINTLTTSRITNPREQGFLLYGASDEKAKNRLTDPELINQFKAIEEMEEDDRNVVKKLIDAFITKKQIQKLAN